MLIRIKDLRAQTIIGVNDWERSELQEVCVNIEFEFDGQSAAESDDLSEAVDYASLTQSIVAGLGQWKFFLLEKLASEILAIIMADARVEQATVEVDKPGAIPQARSVSATVSAKRT